MKNFSWNIFFLQMSRIGEEVESIRKQFNKIWLQENLFTGQEPLVLPPPGSPFFSFGLSRKFSI